MRGGPRGCFPCASQPAGCGVVVGDGGGVMMVVRPVVWCCVVGLKEVDGGFKDEDERRHTVRTPGRTHSCHSQLEGVSCAPMAFLPPLKPPTTLTTLTRLPFCTSTHPSPHQNTPATANRRFTRRARPLTAHQPLQAQRVLPTVPAAAAAACSTASKTLGWTSLPGELSSTPRHGDQQRQRKPCGVLL